MDDPLKQPPPSDPIERIHALARDLAYGAVNGKWSSRISISYEPVDRFVWINNIGNPMNIDEYLTDKWNELNPSADVLTSFGYMQQVEKRESGTTVYLLTEKAFTLLEKPTTLPSIFVSYRRNVSSA
ncbi:MAG: hypothetical protein JNJ61_24390, partial [Anaerolineae bacterium]|nr:hypothetical protein [Anaerolineae bacterium]